MTWFKYSCYDECFTYFYLDVTLDECPSGLLLLDMWDLIFIFIWWECMCKYIKLLSEAIINVRLKWKMELFSVWIIIKHRMCNVLNTLVALFIWKGVKCCSVMVKLYLIWISKKKKKSWKWQEKFSCYWVKGHNTFLSSEPQPLRHLSEDKLCKHCSSAYLLAFHMICAILLYAAKSRMEKLN